MFPPSVSASLSEGPVLVFIGEAVREAELCSTAKPAASNDKGDAAELGALQVNSAALSPFSGIAGPDRRARASWVVE